jgi:hypothetical protein
MAAFRRRGLTPTEKRAPVTVPEHAPHNHGSRVPPIAGTVTFAIVGWAPVIGPLWANPCPGLCWLSDGYRCGPATSFLFAAGRHLWCREWLIAGLF